MKHLKLVALLIALTTGAWILPQKASAQQTSGSYQLFYDDLSPYGTWVEYPNYGYSLDAQRSSGIQSLCHRGPLGTYR